MRVEFPIFAGNIMMITLLELPSKIKQIGIFGLLRDHFLRAFRALDLGAFLAQFLLTLRLLFLLPSGFHARCQCSLGCVLLLEGALRHIPRFPTDVRAWFSTSFFCYNAGTAS